VEAASAVASGRTATEKTVSSPGRVMAVVSAAVFMASLDLFVVNIAFPDIQRDFSGSSLAGLSWVLNGYTIVFAALLVPMGRAADRLGRRRFFVGGLLLFVAASAACAVAPGVETLVAARLIQAVGAAAILPTSLAILVAQLPEDKRPAAIGLWAAIGGVAAAAGAADRRAARPGLVALGLPDQRARRTRRRVPRRSRARGEPRPGGDEATGHARHAHLRRLDRSLRPRLREGLRLGLARMADDRVARRRRCRARGVPGPQQPPPHAGARVAAAARAPVRRRRRRRAAVLGGLSARCCLRACCS